MNLYGCCKGSRHETNPSTMGIAGGLRYARPFGIPAGQDGESSPESGTHYNVQSKIQSYVILQLQQL